MGRVYLIGAGPGNEELITLKAIRVLKECDVVLYDRLAGTALLKYVRPDCRIYYCGKEPGCHYKTQEEINEMLVALAQDGNIVGRIKGGDPYVFGRGGEEALALFKEDILFEVIPGITSAISVLDYAGIPITHRGLAQDFHVFTGRSAAELTINWRAAAGLAGTLVFLMGLENIEMIMKNLVDNEKDRITPCAVIMRGTTAKQKCVTGTLENICRKTREAGLKSPCIIVVGDVVSLRDQLNWYERMPLFGLNIGITRAKEQSKELCAKLLKLGADVTEMNAIKIIDTSVNLDPYLEKLNDYDYIVMSSVNSVNFFFDYLKKSCVDVRRLKGMFAVMGPATQKSLQDRGIIAQIMAGEFDSESLSEKLKKIIKKDSKVLIPSSGASRKIIGEDLRAIGCDVDEIDIYKPEMGDVIHEKSFEEVDVVLFTSPSGVKNFIKMISVDTLKLKTILAIGPITQKALLDNGISAEASEKYSTDGMIESLMQLRKKM